MTQDKPKTPKIERGIAIGSTLAIGITLIGSVAYKQLNPSNLQPKTPAAANQIALNPEAPLQSGEKIVGNNQVYFSGLDTEQLTTNTTNGVSMNLIKGLLPQVNPEISTPTYDFSGSPRNAIRNVEMFNSDLIRKNGIPFTEESTRNEQGLTTYKLLANGVVFLEAVESTQGTAFTVTVQPNTGLVLAVSNRGSKGANSEVTVFENKSPELAVTHKFTAPGKTFFGQTGTFKLNGQSIVLPDGIDIESIIKPKAEKVQSFIDPTQTSENFSTGKNPAGLEIKANRNTVLTAKIGPVLPQAVINNTMRNNRASVDATKPIPIETTQNGKDVDVVVNMPENGAIVIAYTKKDGITYSTIISNAGEGFGKTILTIPDTEILSLVTTKLIGFDGVDPIIYPRATQVGIAADFVWDISGYVTDVQSLKAPKIN
jgi:hypothetical protein